MELADDTEMLDSSTWRYMVIFTRGKERRKYSHPVKQYGCRLITCRALESRSRLPPVLSSSSPVNTQTSNSFITSHESSLNLLRNFLDFSFCPFITTVPLKIQYIWFLNWALSEDEEELSHCLNGTCYHKITHTISYSLTYTMQKTTTTMHYMMHMGHSGFQSVLIPVWRWEDEQQTFRVSVACIRQE